MEKIAIPSDLRKTICFQNISKTHFPLQLKSLEKDDIIIVKWLHFSTKFANQITRVRDFVQLNHKQACPYLIKFTNF